jgi:flagellar biosynthesis GTPase FlhF
MTPQDSVGTAGTTGAPRAFRGKSLEEILPQIREALGEDAIILRQREGLSGGVGGFFQQRFVEVEAVAGLVRGFDAYDDEPAFPDDEPLAGPAARAPLPSGRRVEVREDSPAPAAAPGPVAVPGEPAAADAAAPQPAQPTTELDGPAFLRHLDEALKRRQEEEPADEPAAAPVADAPTASTPAPTVAAPTPEPTVAAPAAPAEPRLITYKAARGKIVKAAQVTETTAAAGVPAAPAPKPAVARAAATPVVEPTVAAEPAPAADTAPAAPPAPAVKPWAPKRTAVRDAGARALAGIAAAPEHLQVTVPADATTDEDEPAGAPRRRNVQVPRPAGTVDTPVAPATPTVDVDIAEYVLVSRGLAPEIARPALREAAAAGGALDAATREILEARIPAVAERTDVRTIAVAGGPGSGRTSAVGALCRAYTAEHRSVLVVALRPTDDGAALRAAVAGTRAQVFVAQDGEEIARVRDARDADVCLIDTPVIRKGRAKLIATVTADLQAAGADEIHLAIPGTDAAVGVTATIDAFAELGADALLMTHRDLADRPGGVVSGAILRRLPVSYVTDGRGIALADPAGLARMVQP